MAGKLLHEVCRQETGLLVIGPVDDHGAEDVDALKLSE